jgi:hypothetical protein
LVGILLAIIWILIVPNVDLDPATPLNMEGILFALVAICLMLGASPLGVEVVQRFPWRTLNLPPPSGTRLVTEIAPLRC